LLCRLCIEAESGSSNLVGQVRRHAQAASGTTVYTRHDYLSYARHNIVLFVLVTPQGYQSLASQMRDLSAAVSRNRASLFIVQLMPMQACSVLGDRHYEDCFIWLFRSL